MMDDLENTQLENYYLRLENIDDYISLLLPEGFNWDQSTPELRLKFSIEQNALSRITSEYIKKIFHSQAPEVESYLLHRLQTTINSLLRAKYYHFLYALNKHNENGKNAIQAYLSALNNCYVSDTKQKNYVKFKDLLEVITNLTQELKYKKEELKAEINGYLTNQKVYARLKTWIIMSISKTGLFSIKELSGLPELCCKLAEKESEHRFVEINLELALEISKKLGDIAAQRKINELLGDNEYKKIMPYDGKPESILIPHTNSSTYIKIIQYYKNAKQDLKRDEAILAFNAIKKETKFFKISVPIEQVNHEKIDHFINNRLSSITNAPTNDIIIELIYGTNLLFAPYTFLDKSVDEQADSYTNKYLLNVRTDLNNNNKKTEADEEYKFRLYSLCLGRTLSFTIDIIMHSIKKKKLNYNKLSKFLLANTYFGQELQIKRNGEELNYSIFGIIDIGIKEFFKQCGLSMKDLQVDWRFTIDYLSLKFEGILRVMIELSGGVVTKLDDKGNSTDILLEELLRSNVIDKNFDEDDLNLFKYTFTSKGLNIRNNVAHSFYKPFDYPIRNAVLVFLCILRLAKFNPTKTVIKSAE